MTVMHALNVRRFLETLAQTRKVKDAAEAVGISQSTLYSHRRANPAFRVAWAEALECGEQMLTREAMRRVMEGFEQPVFYQGRKVASVRKYNDALLINLLKLEIKRRQSNEANRKGPQRDELAELLEEIDGKTRGVPRDRGETA